MPLCHASDRAPMVRKSNPDDITTEHLSCICPSEAPSEGKTAPSEQPGPSQAPSEGINCSSCESAPSEGCTAQGFWYQRQRAPHSVGPGPRAALPGATEAGFDGSDTEAKPLASGVPVKIDDFLTTKAQRTERERERERAT